MTPAASAWARRGIVLLACAVTYTVGFWVLWHSLLTGAYGRPGPASVIKDYYLGDQFAYLGIAANVEHGRSAFLEPYTGTGSSIYPSAYFWLLGAVSRAFGTSVFASWNVVGAAIDAALFGGTGLFAWSVTRRPWAWVLGPLPALIGTYQYWTIGSWRAIYGAHAVLWPAAASLFSPGAEPAALVLAGVAVALLTIESRVEGRSRLFATGGAGAAVGLSLETHTYVAIFAATVCGIWFLCRALQLSTTRASRVGVAGAVLATAAAVAMVPQSFPILRAVVVVVGALATTAIGERARTRLVASVLAFAGGAAVVGAPMILRIASQVGDRDSFLYLRQASGVATNLSLPLAPVLLHSLPSLLLAAGCLAHLVRQRRSSGSVQHDGWSAALVALVVGGGLLVANESWGLQQEPYRFLPYAHILVAAASVPWLVARPAGSRLPALVVRAGVAAAIALSFPTTRQLIRETPSILQAPEAQQVALREAADALPEEGLTLLDTCLPPGAFKAVTGARIVAMNEGLALADRPDAVRAVIASIRNGVVAEGAALDAADVTSFVTVDRCRNATSANVAARFGNPIATVRLVSPPTCGLPPLDLEVYRRRIGEGGAAIAGDDVVPPTGTPREYFAPCLFSTGRSDIG